MSKALTEPVSTSISYFNTRETLLHFSKNQREYKGDSKQGKMYNITRLRTRNLMLADIVEDYLEQDYPLLIKVLKSLRCCSKFSLLEKNWIDEIQRLTSSKKCKSGHCAICRKAKSAKLVNRLNTFLNNAPDDFQNQHYYFLTLTVRHDKNIRNYNYLKEFKKYHSKFRRTKIYKANFKGEISSIENVITEGYHIHIHCLMVGRLNDRVANVQADISKSWHKITGDSFNVDLRLLNESNLHKTILEVFKYSMKLPDLKKMTKNTKDLTINWIIETKGKNMLNASGIFRGHQLTGHKSKYDDTYKKESINDDSIHVLTKTAKLKFNYNTKKNYSPRQVKNIKNNVFLKSIDKEAIKLSTGEAQYYNDFLSSIDKIDI